MQILIVAATAFELTPFIQKHPEADCLITGVGAATTIYQLTKKLSKQKKDMILQVGVAGVYDNQLSLSDVVVVSKDRFADLGAMEKGRFNSVATMGLLNDNAFPYEHGWLKNPHLSKFEYLPQSVAGNTVNLITDDLQHLQSIQHDAVVESMEGAALHYVCLMEDIPFLQIRGISNHAGDRNHNNWKMKEAIDKSCEYLSDLYQQLLLNKHH